MDMIDAMRKIQSREQCNTLVTNIKKRARGNDDLVSFRLCQLSNCMLLQYQSLRPHCTYNKVMSSATFGDCFAACCSPPGTKSCHKEAEVAMEV